MSEFNMNVPETGSLHPLVEPEWLEKHLDDPDLRIVDATVQVKLWPFPHVRSGRRGFKRGHIPGATFADLLKISDPQRPSYTFTMPTAERFADHMGRLGIGNGTRVVLYDGRENMWAARLWWMLRTFGFDDAAVLNGGWKAWRLEDRPVSSKPCEYPATRFTPHVRPELIVGKEEVLTAIEDPTTCIVNALGRRQHRGERKEYGGRGHIPGAKNVTAWEILDRKTMRYRPAEELRELFRPMLEAERVITYCGGGIASSSDAFILHLLGHPNVAVYDGGLIEWSADRSLPLELGE
ncbi:sulfurtransferase [Marinobacter sp. M216]|uniref:Sulfurtransferase n=1 Tax=Marinobacter albus TaxID=3030833 RepID=A0ABT7HD17_9GAMM|nr:MULTISPECIES: sulfurtransferase [unclassified Marinobacter]MBW7469482.1 sulfurtransferase [Marinobacter sp. F4218]MDK9558249.1 sulfurtransferase [Marinobacter sp. M216]